MRNYINKNGEITKAAPSEVIEIEDCFTGKVAKNFEIVVLKENNEFLGVERFYSELPTNGNILWAIAKHNGDKAELRVFYVPETDC
jgi:hypothetical protein